MMHGGFFGDSWAEQSDVIAKNETIAIDVLMHAKNDISVAFPMLWKNPAP
jgi:hypothetical protein